jgi:NitT/TauT family transport system substrate-binding protein
MNPDGKVNVDSLAADLAFYKQQGLVEADVKIEQIVDHSFVEVALQQLGPYRKERLQ